MSKIMIGNRSVRAAAIADIERRILEDLQGRRLYAAFKAAGLELEGIEEIIEKIERLVRQGKKDKATFSRIRMEFDTEDA